MVKSTVISMLILFHSNAAIDDTDIIQFTYSDITKIPRYSPTLPESFLTNTKVSMILQSNETIAS